MVVFKHMVFRLKNRIRLSGVGFEQVYTLDP